MSSEKRSKEGSRDKRPTAPVHPATETLPIPRLRRADEVVTAAQLVAMVVAYFGSDSVRGVIAIGCVVVFGAGAVLFSWAFLIAAGRSRREEVTVAGAFFLAGSTTKANRQWAYRLLVAQSVIGIAAAAADPYTAMAFGILVAMFGLGVIAFLGSAHGTFHPRKATK